MDKLLEKLHNIFEVERLPMDLRLDELPNWDSLNALSILALLDSEYGISMSATDLINFKDLKDFSEYVIKNKR